MQLSWQIWVHCESGQWWSDYANSASQLVRHDGGGASWIYSKTEKGKILFWYGYKYVKLLINRNFHPAGVCKMCTSWMICRRRWSQTFPVTFTWCSMFTGVQTFLFIGTLSIFTSTIISILLLQKEFLQHRECADIGTTLSYDVFGEQGKHFKQ